MATVEVFNPTSSPVVYGDARTIAGFERAIVEDFLVTEHLRNGTLRSAKKKPEIFYPEPKPTPPQNVFVDSDLEQTDVPLNTDEQETSGTAEETSHVDGGSTVVTPATISKTRRRKLPVKE